MRKTAAALGIIFWGLSSNASLTGFGSPAGEYRCDGQSSSGKTFVFQGGFSGTTAAVSLNRKSGNLDRVARQTSDIVAARRQHFAEGPGALFRGMVGQADVLVVLSQGMNGVEAKAIRMDDTSAASIELNCNQVTGAGPSRDGWN